jgi:hypothetical protein
VAAQWASVADYALLTFQTAAGALINVRLPAPQAGIFLADGETVDPAQIGGIIAAVVADVVTPSGAALTAYVSGTRQRKA